MNKQRMLPIRYEFDQKKKVCVTNLYALAIYYMFRDYKFLFFDSCSSRVKDFIVALSS